MVTKRSPWHLLLINASQRRRQMSKLISSRFLPGVLPSIIERASACKACAPITDNK